jgi:DNA (cytosine-5)-methyltransferase 1
MTDKRLAVGTTFSGIGAPEQALKNLGIPHDVKWACDICPKARKTYLANHSCETMYEDITSLDPTDLAPVDLYVFGFPCQDVSMMGKRNLSGGRTALVNYSLDIIDHLKPSYILFENVKGLLSKKFKPFLDGVLARLGEDYNLDLKVFNSKFFGVPQNRERVYCLGTRKDLPQVMLPVQGTATLHLSTVLETSPGAFYTLSDESWRKAQAHKARMKARGNGFGYKLLIDCCTTLLTSSCYELIPQVGKNPRKLTERECARLHGFPESFVIPVSYNQARKQFGNTITVPVLEAIFGAHRI